MDNLMRDAAPHILADQFDAFRNRRGIGVQAGIGDVMDTFGVHAHWEAHVFGGFPRDLMVDGHDATPRDLDIVLARDCISEVKDELAEYVDRVTRFGGLHLSIGGWDVDVWSLEQTWAFRNDEEFEMSFEDLPKTTFLDVDAVAVSLNERRNRVREHGFFDALRTKTVGVNYRPNPYPALCVVRAFDIARRLDFALDVELVSYILETTEKLSPEDLLEAQKSHYGEIRLQPSELDRMLRTLQKRRYTNTGAVHLPPT